MNEKDIEPDAHELIPERQPIAGQSDSPANKEQVQGEKDTTNGINPEKFRAAVQQVVEYMHDEAAHYRATIEEGQSGEHHIHRAVCTLRAWLDIELKQTADGQQSHGHTDNARESVEPASIRQMNDPEPERQR